MLPAGAICITPSLGDLVQSVSKLRNGLEVTGGLGDTPATGCWCDLALQASSGLLARSPGY